jgi:hypothetical protein
MGMSGWQMCVCYPQPIGHRTSKNQRQKLAGQRPTTERGDRRGCGLSCNRHKATRSGRSTCPEADIQRPEETRR